MKKHSHNTASSLRHQLDSTVNHIGEGRRSSVQSNCSCGSSSGNSQSRPIETPILMDDMIHFCLYITTTCLGSRLVSYYYCQSLLVVSNLLALLAESPLRWIVGRLEIYSCFRMTMYWLSRLRQRQRYREKIRKASVINMT